MSFLIPAVFVPTGHDLRHQCDMRYMPFGITILVQFALDDHDLTLMILELYSLMNLQLSQILSPNRFPSRLRQL